MPDYNVIFIEIMLFYSIFYILNALWE